MQKLKRVVAAGMALALAGCLSVGLTACGSKEGVAATWANGEITEEQVTNYVENMRSLYGYSSNASGWEDFLKKRTYDIEQTSDLSELTKEESKKEEEAKKDEGTVQEYREYVIKQIARNDVVEWEAGQRNLEVTDEELDAEVEKNKAQVEAQYMSGTFESILQMQGYKDLDAYKEELKTSMQVDKLEQEIVGCKSTDEKWDQDKWDKFVDGLMDYANLQINEMPSNLSYDPANASVEVDTSGASSESGDDADAESTDTDVTATTESSDSGESSDK